MSGTKRRAVDQAGPSAKAPRLAPVLPSDLPRESEIEVLDLTASDVDDSEPPTTSLTHQPKPCCRANGIAKLLKNMDKIEVELHLNRTRSSERSLKQRKKDRAAHKQFVRLTNAMHSLQITKSSDKSGLGSHSEDSTRVASQHQSLDPTLATIHNGTGKSYATARAPKPPPTITHIQLPLPSLSSFKFTFTHVSPPPATSSPITSFSSVTNIENTIKIRSPSRFFRPTSPKVGFTCNSSCAMSQVTESFAKMLMGRSDRQEAREWIKSLPGADMWSCLQPGGEMVGEAKYIYSL